VTEASRPRARHHDHADRQQLAGAERLTEDDEAALAGFVVLDQDLGARELLAIAMVVVASAGAASLSDR